MATAVAEPFSDDQMSRTVGIDRDNVGGLAAVFEDAVMVGGLQSKTGLSLPAA